MNYKNLKRDFLLVNMVSALALGVLLCVICLQQSGILPHIPCGVHDILHVYCPGCGGTRALSSLLQGKVICSLYYNPAIVLGILLIAYYEVGVLLTLYRRNGRRYYERKGWLVYGYLLILVLYSVGRDVLLFMGYDLIGDFLN
ncbi:MAG: DUF2752 domain-containing protein [Lachnospiraceae bacterium]|nr:DUF2752 domain-containing protein [Lachnospiraceae bacterium]